MSVKGLWMLVGHLILISYFHVNIIMQMTC